MMFNLNTTLKSGSHRLPSEGSCTMEVAVLAAGYGWTEVRSEEDLPPCMCRVIGAFVIRLNDAMPDADRQRLIAFIPRLTATAGDEDVQRRRAEYLAMHAAKPATVSALRSAGLHDHADAVAGAATLADLSEAAKRAARAALAAARAAAEAAMARAAWARAAAATPFDWQPYLDALDGALRIGPQAPDLDADLIRERVRVLTPA